MKCVVTGGAGFIGRHVVSELVHRGYSVVVYDTILPEISESQSPVTYIRGDIRDTPKLQATLCGGDAVFHLSGILGTHELFDRPHEAVDVNVNGALNVLIASKMMQVSRVFLPAKPNEWNNVYSATSQAVEKLGHAYREHMGVDVRILKLFNIYGPGQKIFPVRKIIPTFSLQAIENMPIAVYGDGSQTVELIYVRDAATVIVDFMEFESEVNETYEFGGQCLSALEIARKIVALSSSQSAITNVPMRTGEALFTNFTRSPDVRHLFDVAHRVDADEGLRLALNWYRELPRSLLKDAKEYYEKHQSQTVLS